MEKKNKQTQQEEQQNQEFLQQEEAQQTEESTEGQEDAAPSSWEEERNALLERVSELEKENGELRDTLARKQADLDNFRKRMLREKEEAIRFANKELLQDLLTVIDDFERAIQSAEESKDFDSFHEGVKLIEKQFVSMLQKKWGLQRMESLNQEFDPQEHEALMMIESGDHDTQTVVEDFQKGYYYQEKVLRPAKVKVAVPAKGDKKETSEENA